MGHLNGLAHCPEESCVMRPVLLASDLNTRPSTPCGHCPGHWKVGAIRKALACVLISAIVFLANSLLSSAFHPAATPFSCWCVDACRRPSFGATGGHDEVSIYFERRKLLTLFDRDGRRTLRDRSLPAVQSLNALINRRSHGLVTARRASRGRWVIGVAGSPAFLETLPGDTRGTDSTEQLASKWAEVLNASLSHYDYENKD